MSIAELDRRLMCWARYTARVRLGAGVTIGLRTVVGIGVEAGDGCKVGALSFVPKCSWLKAGAVCVGCPVREREAVDARHADVADPEGAVADQM